MKISVCTVAYNEAEWIERCVRQFRGWVERHLVLVSSEPWFGPRGPDDGTAEIARAAGAEVDVRHWKTEAEQRNWGLARLWDSDYVLIVDADEFYSRGDIDRLLAILSASSEACFRAAEMRTYWKSPQYVCHPLDVFSAPVIAVDPKRVLFHKFREPVERSAPDLPQNPLPVTLHHMSWAKSDAKIREKIGAFSHAEWVPANWYDEVWLKWVPGMEEIAPYGGGEMRAIFCPCPPLDHQ